MERTSENLIVVFASWWYGEARNRLVLYLKFLYHYLLDLFSVKVCLKTLFSPWRRDQISTEGLAIKQVFEVWMMNLVSRLVGFMVKTITLLIFSVATLVYTGIALTVLFVWYFYPIVILALIIFGFKNLLP